MTDNDGNAVRVTNADIYRELLAQGRKLDRVASKVEDVLKPGLDGALASIEGLKNLKADKEAMAMTNGRVAQIEMRLYAIVAGLIAAIMGARGLGVL